MPYAGYRRAGGVAPTQDQGNPFYDPYSQTPNWGAGLQSIVQNLWQMDALKKQQEAEAAQQAFENQMKMGDYDYKRAQTEALRGRPDKPAIEPSAEAKTIEYLISIGIPQETAAQMVTNYKPETELPMLPGMDKTFSGLTPESWKGIPKDTRKQLTDEFLTRTRPDKPGTMKADPRVKGAESYASNLEKVYTKAIEDIQKQSQGSASARSMAALLGKPMAEDTSSSEVTNLESALSEIRRIQAILAGGTVPEQSDLDLLKRLGTDIQSIRKSGLNGGATQPAAPVDEIESNPEFQAYVAAHPEEPKGRIRAMFKRYLATQKR